MMLAEQRDSSGFEPRIGFFSLYHPELAQSAIHFSQFFEVPALIVQKLCVQKEYHRASSCSASLNC
jgi:hypothetical protein